MGSSDPWLLVPTRSYLSEDMVCAYASTCESETLILLAKDGILSVGTGKLKIHDYVDLLGIYFGFVLSLFSSVLSILLLFCPENIAGVAKLKKIRDGINIVIRIRKRLRLIKHRKIVILPTGGHHLHLTEPEMVASELGIWQANRNASRKCY